MEFTSDKMIKKLQEKIDWVQYDRKHNEPEKSDFATFATCKQFVEEVTGRKVIVKNWKVMWAD